MLYSVTYKAVGKGKKTTIVKARNEELAAKAFNDPSEVGKTAEIKEVKKAKSIPKDWFISFQKGREGFPLTGKASGEVKLSEVDTVTLIVGGKRKVEVKISEITGAFKPGKDKKVMNRGSY